MFLSCKFSYYSLSPDPQNFTYQTIIIRLPNPPPPTTPHSPPKKKRRNNYFLKTFFTYIIKTKNKKAIRGWWESLVRLKPMPSPHVLSNIRSYPKTIIKKNFKNNKRNWDVRENCTDKDQPGSDDNCGPCSRGEDTAHTRGSGYKILRIYFLCTKFDRLRWSVLCMFVLLPNSPFRIIEKVAFFWGWT